MRFSTALAAAGLAALVGLAIPGAPALAQDDLLKSSWSDIEAAAKQEGQLTFYAWWGEEFWRTAAANFEADTGIKVNVVIGDGNATIGKVIAEAGSKTGTIDAMLVGGQELKLLFDANALYGPIAPVVPGADKLDAKLSKVQEGYQTGGYLLPVYRNQVGILYDPDKVPNPPQTWADFQAWIDANPGQFAFNDPSKGGAGQAIVQAAIVNILGNPEAYVPADAVDPALVAKWSAVWDWFNANKDKFTITSSNSDSVDRVNQGEASMAAAWDDDTLVALSKGTLFKRAKIYIPAFGLAGGGDSLGIPANAPNKAAALLFLSYLIQPKVQILLNATIGSYVARVDVTPESSIIPEEQRQQNSRAWLPGIYKSAYIQGFVAEVLQK